MEEDDDPEEMTTAPLSPEETPPSPDETVRLGSLFDDELLSVMAKTNRIL
jgi:hypothetical protein